MTLRRFSGLLAAGIALAVTTGFASGASLDGATIVNSGSTNTVGYAISVWSNGKGSVQLQTRLGQAESSRKAFAISSVQAVRFFADVKAARDGHAKGVPCMKSASFGSSTHVNWHGWTSPDLACPPGDALAAALARDVTQIRKTSGVDAMPHARGRLPGMLPGHPSIPMPASPTPSPAKGRQLRR